MNLEEKTYQLALSYVPKIGERRFKKLINHFGSAKTVWELNKKEKNNIQSLNVKTLDKIGDSEILETAIRELDFVEKNNFKAHSFYEIEYPRLLKECIDAPPILFTRGNIDFTTGKFVAIVGTRNMSAIGKSFVEELVSGFSNQPITIVSGLALGIDAEAHKQAINNDLQTIGVLAHGIDKIYPKSNKNIAMSMLDNGGLVSEFSTFHPTEPINFLKRNRIIAGLSDATIIVESRYKGGAMSTAKHANNYNRDVFAMPGRINDLQSKGCNFLIKNHQAFLLTEANDVLQYLNITPQKKKKIQTEIFVELSDEEKQIYDHLQKEGKLHIDQMAIEMDLPTYRLMPTLLSLELKNIINPLPGKFYEVV